MAVANGLAKNIPISLFADGRLSLLKMA